MRQFFYSICWLQVLFSPCGDGGMVFSLLGHGIPLGWVILEGDHGILKDIAWGVGKPISLYHITHGSG
ncbi:hypothetical protein [Pasteuria penetrans]|uniref:hypothetical protein n=1 Tax=Pasteuria penetrans TaxID=86005 RepID=UPI000FC2CFE5|nr:hypothetical protein [Pasteuria penetrans]